MKKMIFAGILVSGLLSVGYCFAEVPGKFICGAAEASGCAQDEPCLRGSAERLSLPLIWKVDLEQKNIWSIRENGDQKNSKIHEVIDIEDALILFGVDHTTPWSIYIDKTDGKMTLTTSTYDAGYVVHGMCSSKILP
jgi:hypothetical protein